MRTAMPAGNKLSTLTLAIALALSSQAYAASFTIENGEVVTTQQTLNNNETGTIETGGELNTAATAIQAPGSTVSINNSGSIITSGDSALGIFSLGSDANINNSGSIITTGISAYGILSTGSDADINNSGSISTSGSSAAGIASTGANISINNSGSIITSNQGGYGIASQGSDATINNSGSITTSGVNSYGIWSINSDAIIDNSGRIMTSGGGAHGIFSQGINAIINNSGSISTSGNIANGIRSTASEANIYNSGSINTSGTDAFGILSSGSDVTINNSGSISTSGGTASGIRSEGSNASIKNSGSITTSGNLGDGILSTGSNAIINNSGSINTSGGARGIRSAGINANINNSGSIISSGNLAIGILATNNNATIYNSGLISATGVDSYAILGLSNDITLNLLSGSQIIGRIDLGDNGGDNDTVNVYGIGSANLTFENVENINLFGTGLVSGNNVISVDPTGESTRGVALSSMTSSIHSVIGQRMARTAPLKPVQLASLELSPSMYFEEHKPVAWAQVFGGRFDRDAEGSAMAYDHNHVGVNFGYEWDISGHRAGLMGGIVRSTTETQTASFETEADNYYVGAYANRKTHGLNITGSLIAGYSDHDNDRLVVDNLNGVETAKSDFNSWFISPGLTIGSAFTVNERIELRPSVSVNYSIAWLDDYRESGTTNSNLSVDDRKAKAFTARAQLAAAYQFDATSEFEFRVGLNSRHTDDDDTKVGIAGSQFRFANAGDESVTGGFAGASLRVANDNNLSLVTDIEFGGNSDESYAAGQISLEYVF